MHCFDVYDAATDCHHFYLYPEWDGSAGPDEVISMLHEHVSNPLMQRRQGSGILVIWADNCAGQNQNQYICGFLNEMADPNSPMHKYRRIDIRFPYPGHTFLICDRAFSVLERYASGQSVLVPSHLPQVVKKAFRSRQYREMFPRTKFKSWKKSLATKYSILNKTLIGGNPYESAEKIRFNDVMWMNFGQFQCTSHPNEMWFKYTLDECEPWNRINILKRGGML